MATFFTILQKYYQQDTIFLIKNDIDRMEMWDYVCTHQYISKDIARFVLYYQLGTIYDKKKSKKSKNIYDIISHKFTCLDKMLSNIFNTPDINDKILTVFSKLQKIYYAFSKVAYLYKIKKTKIQVNTDLCMNELSDTDPKIFSLYQNKVRYLFTIKDLINIINSSLSHTISFIPDPIPCKNPYNNVILNQTELYNIYFFIRQSSQTMPELFHGYMRSNFDIILFRNHYETLIIDASIKNFIYNSHHHILYPIVIAMLNNYRAITKKIKIHDEFPRNNLVVIFKPYIHLYYISLYATNGTYNQCSADYILKNKLRLFVGFNPFFGRKYIVQRKMIDNKKITEYYFNNSHIHFYKENKPVNHYILPMDEEVDQSDSDSDISNYYETDDDLPDLLYDYVM